MILSFSSNAFKKFSLDTAIKEIAKIGYKGVEILCDIPHAYPPVFGDKKVDSLKSTLMSCDIQISNLNAFTLYAIGDVYRPSWIDEDGREARIQHTIDCINLAKKLGAAHISTEPGGPVLSSLLSTNDAHHQLEKIFLDGLIKAAKVAEQENILLLVEPEPFLLIENSQQFKSFMKKVNSDFVKLNFDIGHFYCVNEDPARLVYELSEYIEHFHLADISSNRVHNHLIPGKGSIAFRSVFKAMDDIGYRGYVTVELYPYQDNPVLAAKEAHDYLCSIL
jgi:sugar phosphate isomerase/epimerase